MATAGKLERIKVEWEGFETSLRKLTKAQASHFVVVFESAAARFLTDKLTAPQFGGLVGELRRDAVGTAFGNVTARSRAGVSV